MLQNCKLCGKEFATYLSKIKIGRGKYCSKECCLIVTNKILESNGAKTRFFKGQASPASKGGRAVQRSRKGGKEYVLIYTPLHPFADHRGYVREHRLVMEQSLGRHLLPSEVVHHLDENTLNNDLSNLQIMSWKEHRVEHLKDNIHKRWQKETIPQSSRESLLLNI